MPAGSFVSFSSTPSRAFHRPGLEPDAVEVARQRADVRRDRHAVVVEDDDDRRAEAAGLVDRLERDAAGHRAVADHRDDLAVGAVAAAHRLLDPDRVADRGRGVAGAHDVVLGLVDRAERRQAAVLADRAEPVAAAGEDLVRVGLVADVPEDLVRRASRAASAARRRSRRCRGWRRSGRRSPPPCRSAARAPPGRPAASSSSVRPWRSCGRSMRSRSRVMSVRVAMKSVICSSSAAPAAAAAWPAPPARCGATPRPARAPRRARSVST